MKKFAEDIAFLDRYGVERIELMGDSGRKKLCLVPDWQGRVVSSTAQGDQGDSFGWINRTLIASRQIHPRFNPLGGEERFWLGPEGGPYSLYFAPGAGQEYANWQVPAALDTESFHVEELYSDRVRFSKQMSLGNAAGVQFEIAVDRSVALLSRSQIQCALNVWLPDGVSEVAYRSENRITNAGERAWEAGSGAPSIWMLSMFAPSAGTVVFLPVRDGAEYVVNDAYFTPPGSERLVGRNGAAFFRCDGTFRSKIGLPAGCDSGLCGSYDRLGRTLTLLRYTPSAPGDRYVNSCWGDQADPFAGDVVNAYNDGPTESGELMGPFYELETSSPAAFLKPGQSLCHVQETFHFQGSEQALDTIVRNLFHFGIYDLKHAF